MVAETVRLLNRHRQDVIIRVVCLQNSRQFPFQTKELELALELELFQTKELEPFQLELGLELDNRVGLLCPNPFGSVHNDLFWAS